jgi:hypothetical protein
MATEKPQSDEPVFVEEKDHLRCRFYENQYPEPEEVVMANVTEIGEMGAYVTLLEYDNIEVSSAVLSGVSAHTAIS